MQCSGFSGPNTVWPHHLTGCVRQDGSAGSGVTNRTGPVGEMITWTAPFVNGMSMELTGITSTIVSTTSPHCPRDHPVEANVSGTIGPGSRWVNSPVSATICGDTTDFALKPGTLFVIGTTPDAVASGDTDEP